MKYIKKNSTKLRDSSLALILFISFSFLITSCRTANESLSETNSGDTVSVAENDLNESNEDLLSVDYKEFYNDLAPHGEWIEVNSDDVGVEIKPSSSRRHYKEDELPKISIASLLGIKDAHADLSVSTFYIWKPSANLAVGISAGETQAAPTPAYVPYTNGEWVSTTEGWYFKAPTPHEEIVHHYGRWMNSPSLGWVWVPGRVRSPAWVSWREDDNYVAWTPIAPSVYVVNNVIPEPQVEIVENNYVVVEKKYFVEPQVYRYFYPETRVKIRGMKHINGIVVRDRVIYDSGPDVVVIEKHVNRKIVPVQVVNVNSIDQTVYNVNQLKVYSPTFRKVKIKGDKYTTVAKPPKFSKHNDVIEKYQLKKNEAASDFNREDRKEFDKRGNDSKQFNKKFADDSDMRTGKKNKRNDDLMREDKKQRKELQKDNNRKEKRDVVKDRAPKEKRDDNRKEKVKRNDKPREEKNKDRGKDRREDKGKDKKSSFK